MGSLENRFCAACLLGILLRRTLERERGILDGNMVSTSYQVWVGMASHRCTKLRKEIWTYLPYIHKILGLCCPLERGVTLEKAALFI